MLSDILKTHSVFAHICVPCVSGDWIGLNCVLSTAY